MIAHKVKKLIKNVVGISKQNIMSDELKFKKLFAFRLFVCDFTKPGKDNYDVYVGMFIHILIIQNNNKLRTNYKTI